MGLPKTYFYLHLPWTANEPVAAGPAEMEHQERVMEVLGGYLTTTTLEWKRRRDLDHQK